MPVRVGFEARVTRPQVLGLTTRQPSNALFVSCMCTADNIYVLHGLMKHLLNINIQLYCSFIDFSQCFDYVVRDVLWFKLIKYGVRGKMLDIIMSMYNNIKIKVSKGAKIRNRHNKNPHLTQDTKGKVTNSQL